MAEVGRDGKDPLVEDLMAEVARLEAMVRQLKQQGRISTFDRNAYQRDYMRRRRAKQKATG